MTNTTPLDYSSKTDRQVRAIYNNSSPLLPNFKRYSLALQTELGRRHRAAYAERQSRIA